MKSRIISRHGDQQFMSMQACWGIQAGPVCESGQMSVRRSQGLALVREGSHLVEFASACRSSFICRMKLTMNFKG